MDIQSKITMLLFRFSAWLFILPMSILYSCSSINSEAGIKNKEIAFRRDSTFEIKGISIEAPSRPITIKSMDEIAEVNANWIALMPYAFCRKDDPTVYFSSNHQWWGERDEGIIDCIRLARQKHFKVMLKPHLWVGDGGYTGNFKMQDDDSWKKWEDSYGSYILHFALLADSMQVELFCIGTELGSSVSERPFYWSLLIDTVKKVYHGKLTYAANWDDYAQFPFWNKLDLAGIDAYFPLVNAATPTPIEIQQAWKKPVAQLEKFSRLQSIPVMFTEYGYRNADNCAATPWKEGSRSLNNAAQANAYEGFYNSFSNKKWFKGGFVWKWHADNLHNHSGAVDYTPQAKPALNIIRKFYGSN